MILDRSPKPELRKRKKPVGQYYIRYCTTGQGGRHTYMGAMGWVKPMGARRKTAKTNFSKTAMFLKKGAQRLTNSPLGAGL